MNSIFLERVTRIRNTLKIVTGVSLLGLIGILVLNTQSAFAASTVIVRPSNMQGWTNTNQNLGATVGIIPDASAQFGQGSLQFHTSQDTDSKAQISKLGLNIPLSAVTELSYWTKQNAGNTYNYELPSYQLRLDMDGTGHYVTDFYYYPSANTSITSGTANTIVNTYPNSIPTTVDINPDLSNTVTSYTNSVVTPTAPDIKIGVWQKWDVLTSGKWASYQPIPGTFDSIPELTPGEGGIDSGIAGAARGGGEFYSITDILRKYPSARVVGIGSDLGPLYENSVSFADAISINNTVYDFENNLTVPEKKADCKNNSWKNVVGDNGKAFKNRGQCTTYVEHHSHKVTGNVKYSANGLSRSGNFEMNTADNKGVFDYSDSSNAWYKAKVSTVRVNGDDAWFAGVVTKASNPSWVNNWLFVKVKDASPDQISGSFTDQTTAQNGVTAMTLPTDGPFTVTKGNLKVK